MRYSTLATELLKPWSRLNDVETPGCEVQSHIIAENGVDIGGGLVATRAMRAGEVILHVPRGLILNKASINDLTKIDQNLRQITDSLDPKFLQTPRLLIMVFLLLQLTYSSPDTSEKTKSFASPFKDYVSFLPKSIPLPIFYNTFENELLAGTSLEVALKQKLARLEQEFDELRSATLHVPFCQTAWWTGPGPISLEDWKLVDAMYRSRALELPNGVGDSMVPVLDMANHSAEGKYNARFQLDNDGNALLVVRDERSIHRGDEITIMYGCGGACEMIFSYGFLDANAQSAREIFLDLQIPPDDPLQRAKVQYAQTAPGVRIYAGEQGQTKWESSFVWWACINEEDGLEFELAQQVDGSIQLTATWRDKEFKAQDLPTILQTDPLWDVFLLRAIVIIQERVEAQGAELSQGQEELSEAFTSDDADSVTDTIKRLRDLEMDLLAAAYMSLEEEKSRLASSDVVRTYLNQEPMDDFS